jgi:hypothetical protein
MTHLHAANRYNRLTHDIETITAGRRKLTDASDQRM